MLNARGLTAKLFALAVAATAAATPLGIVAAPEGDREISFYHIHTKETLSIVYKRNGKYIPEAMDKIDWVMRDWRENKAIKMDPKAIDILWEIHTELGSKEPIHIICGYRSGSTNKMLRRTVGGQARNSKHITGKAIDVYFPDVPSKFVRYAALVRERGGVGYYPTSALPFTHVDTGRVRHWPRMGKDELALLFPNGRSKHVSSGGALRSGDYERAKSRRKELAIEVANFVELRVRPKTPVSLVASIGLPKPPAPKPARRPVKAAPPAAVATAPAPPPVTKPAQAPTSIAALIANEPKLVAAPRPIERTSRFTARPSNEDRKSLAQLMKLAALEPAPKLVTPPSPAGRPQTGKTPDSATEQQLAGGGWEATTWTPAPAFDDDHPEELSYTPFPLTPLLTATSSADDPALAQMVHPDIARTLEVIDDAGAIQPLRFRPKQKVAELMLAQQFRGNAVYLGGEAGETQGRAPQGLNNRAVKTSARSLSGDL